MSHGNVAFLCEAFHNKAVLRSVFREVSAGSCVRLLDSRAEGKEVFCELLEGIDAGEKAWVFANVIAFLVN